MTAHPACLMLLYAQPASRIVRLDGDQVLIRLGEPPSPVPEALAGLLLHLVDNRQNLTTATNPGNRWLFPGKQAGQPLHARTLPSLIHQLATGDRSRCRRGSATRPMEPTSHNGRQAHGR